MSLELNGTIKIISEVEGGISKAGKEWKKQNFVIANDDGYEGQEQIFAFEVFGDEAVENLTKYNKEGDKVKVLFNIKTNEWKGKYFTSLNAWRIEKTTEEGKTETKEAVQDLPF